MRPVSLIISAISVMIAMSARADAPVIEQAVATQIGDRWRVDVTLRHPDSGWDHYADGWRVEDAGGEVLATRLLAHPHVTEQPFTRSLTGITISQGAAVVLRARCSVDGWNTETIPLVLR